MLKRLLLLGVMLGLGALAPVQAEVWLAKYGVAKVFPFKLYNADGTLDVDEADGGTEVSLSCDQGAETTATNDFVDEGTTYSISLTAAELQCQTVVVVIAATTTEAFFIQTFGHASAFNTGLAANTGASDFQAGAIDAAAIATDAIGAAEIASAAIAADEIATDAIGAAELAADAIGAAEIADAALDNATFGCSGGSFLILGVVDCGTAQSASSTTLVLRSAAAFGDDTTLGNTLIANGSTQGYAQSRSVTDYVGATDTGTVDAWQVTPSGTITYYLFGTSPSSGSGGSLTASDVWSHATRTLTAIDEDSTTLDLNATAIGSIAAGGIAASSFASGAIDATAIAADAIGASEIATDAIGAAEIAASAIGSSELADGGITSAEFGTGAITATVIATDAIGSAEVADGAIDAGAFASDAITAAKVAADVTTELQSGLATASALSTLSTTVGTPAGASVSADIAAIEAQTDDIGAAGAGLTAADDAVISAIAALNNLSAAQLRDLVIEDQGSITLGCALASILAYTSGDIATSGANSTYEESTGTETRLTITVSSPGNRVSTITCPTY
jgi:hypothetical protein